MIKKTISFLYIAILLIHCSPENSSQKGEHYQFGLPMKQKKVDSDQDEKIDSIGYYLDDPGNYRVVYQEIDRDRNNTSDTFLWVGLSPTTDKKKPVRKVVKVHEEEDTNLNGKIDTLRWMLPNDFIALSQEDRDNDGYFETTVYYNFKKKPVRYEKDTNFDGKADFVYWQTRVEIDSNQDQIFDKFKTTTSIEQAQNATKEDKQLQPLSKAQSWFHNRKLIPATYASIIGSGM